jgi:4-alpha-glucanotransferase
MTALEALASRCGIVAAFTDARGERRSTSAEMQRALLAAMGIAAADDAAARASLEELERREWHSALPPVRVFYPGEPPAVELNLTSSASAIAWHLALEDGGERRGAALAESLPLLAESTQGGVRHQRRRLLLDVELPFGYHHLSIDPGGGVTTLISTPGKCWLPLKIVQGRRLWGVAAQLYLLRSARDWGIGDYGDLRCLVELVSRRGADVVGVNPLHALFADDPQHASPYSPSSRLLLNVLNIDVTGMAEFARCDAARALVESESFQQALRRCHDAQQVDYCAVADLKLRVLRCVHAAVRSEPGSAGRQALAAFRHKSGAAWERACLFLALRLHLLEQSADYADWHAWPAEYRDPASASVTRFAREHADLVTFQAWLQFTADLQLGAAAQAAAHAANPMAVGLYRDLAVGADRSGAETWSNQRAVVAEAAVGAPPDIYNPSGQDWGLPPFNPVALRAEAYRSFVELIRANMRHGGGLRIDHVMALQQLYWVPRGQPPTHGAYVRYPLDDLVGILALESQRNRCLVVGEDLGTVPAGFRERMAAANILSYRVLIFEREEHGFIAPDRYPKAAVAVAGSHDLPTLRAWWEESDLKLKKRLERYPTAADAERARSERKRDRRDLVAALQSAGLDADAKMGIDALIMAAHRFLARSHSALALAQLDDITAEAAPVNVPTTADEYPNWRRRLHLTLEQIAAHPRFTEIVRAFNDERGMF